MSNVATASAPAASRPIEVRLAVALLGALLVAVSAQVAVPLPGTPVPMTLQPLAVLIVGGLLGARMGALSMAMYLAMGALGLPVFTPGGLPGLARLIGPTGGYLLAYPFAAALTGWIANLPSSLTAGPPDRLTAGAQTILAALAGMLVIHVGGWAQLAILTGSAPNALILGNLPFVLGDVAKVVLAATVVRLAGPATRSLR